MKIKSSLITFALAAITAATHSAPLGPAFTYQGRLLDGGQAANNLYDLTFTLHDDAMNATALGSSVVLTAVPVTNGYFTVAINAGGQFGPAAFDGSARWLEISARTNGGGPGNTFVPLTPRQPLTAAPHALCAATAPWSGVSGTPLSFTPDSVGTLGPQALQLRLNGTAAFRLEPTADTPNIVGGFAGNSVAPNLAGVTIGGGGTALGNQPNVATGAAQYATIAGGYNNKIMGYGGVILGGSVNLVDGSFSGIGGGQFHAVTGDFSWICGGLANTNDGDAALIGGGQNNQIEANNIHSILLGGVLNRIQYGAARSFIGSGVGNTIASNCQAAVITGGSGNTVSNAGGAILGGATNVAAGYFSGVGAGILHQSLGYRSWIGGGFSNTATAFDTTVNGGRHNQALAGNATVGGGALNAAAGVSSTIAGGFQNSANATDATVGGGYTNTASGYRSTVAGGALNAASLDHAVVSGGYGNAATALNSSVGGGSFNSAEGQAAVVGGGLANKASGLHAFVGSGQSNQVTGGYGIVAGGFNNKAGASHCVIASGDDNQITAAGAYSVIGGGFNNVAAEQYSFIGSGGNNTINAGAYSSTILNGFNDAIQSGSYRSVIVAGDNNLVSTNAPLSIIPGGRNARTLSWGQMAHASGGFATKGDAQGSEYILRGQSTATNMTELFLDGASRRLVVPVNGLWGFEVTVVGKKSQPYGSGAAFKFEGALEYSQGNVFLMAQPAKTILGRTDSAYDADVAVDSVNHTLVIKVKGGVTTSPDDFKWVAVVRTTEVIN